MTAPELLYVREGSRFVLYDERRQHTPPIPIPQPVEVEGIVDDPAQPGRMIVAAPRCPHGHFARWAAVNCRPCARSR